MTALQDLDLSETNITNQGLTCLKPLASLRYLQLYRTAVTAEGVNTLKTQMPRTNVYWLPR